MKKALVIFSGGQDSTTCLCWAIEKFGPHNVETISFDYGQRHKIELECAKIICDKLKVPNIIYKIDIFNEISNNALVSDIEIIESSNNLPNTFVPGRNLIFITYAAMHAYNININDLVIGVCETDYSGYPDCRKNTIDSLTKTLNLGMEYNLTIHTPLMNLTKKQTVQLMNDLKYIDLLGYTHTCYNGEQPQCGRCPACKLRAKGFNEANIIDPLIKKTQ